MRSTTQRLVIAFFLAAVVLPSASMLLPVQPAEIENRRVEAPEFSSDRLLEPGYYLDVFRYVRDANPLRAWMITLGTSVDYYLLEDSPNPLSVLLGQDDWLFARTTLDTMCELDVERNGDNFMALIRALEAQDVMVVYTVVPSRFSEHPEKLTDVQRSLAACGIEKTRELRRYLSQNASDGYVDSWSIFAEARAQGDSPHFRTDTHFNYQGSIPWMEALVEAIQPGLWEPEAVQDEGVVEFAGNLGVLIGPRITEDVRKLTIDRGLPTTPREEQHGFLSPTLRSTQRFVAPSDSPPVIQGSAVILKDSSVDLPTPSFVQYFSDITIVDWRNSDSVEYFLEIAPEADIVIVETVDEALAFRFDDRTLADGITGDTDT